RNRVELYGIVISPGTVNTDRNNFVGNDITGTGSGHGQYILPGAMHFTYGNNDNGTILPPGTNVLNDTTYYLNASPTFWNITEPFPNIGTPNPVTGQNNPARQRFLSGSNFTLCGPDVINVGVISAQHQNSFHTLIYPNPVTNEFTIQNSKFTIESIDVYDVVGARVKNLTPFPSPGGEGRSASIDVSMLSPGIYFVAVRDEKNNLVTKKIVKM
ncbi:MAG TPA: T9SS type A sorting domain-containing protein, partial [Bacteroidia bacterium]|nr:T9SS type A sorting domain-containing protein [Bacteroidia bacterium]